ncbi:MAG: hypothetical protein HeimC2_14790 [Candidatus Heimdallarchaeota archaeon LC_2]|nr:MAG: hypothetical protein HeimC2_14790 [Candidatus Heimdallarchaeota archaeon LC_2]
MTFIFFFVFVILQYSAVEENETPIIPNPLSFIVFFTLLFLLTIISQIIEPVNFERYWLIKRNFLATIPPLLGFVISLRFYKEEKKEKRDVVFELMAIVSLIIMAFFTLILVLVLILLYVYGSIETLSFYFMTVGIWGMLGITLGDSHIFYKSEIKYGHGNTLTKLQAFQQNSSIFFSKLFSTSKRRIIGLLSIVITLYLYLIIANSIGSDPISL